MGRYDNLEQVRSKWESENMELVSRSNLFQGEAGELSGVTVLFRTPGEHRTYSDSDQYHVHTYIKYLNDGTWDVSVDERGEDLGNAMKAYTDRVVSHTAYGSVQTMTEGD